MTDEQTSKRALLKRAAYFAPIILALTVVPTFAGSGSGLAEKDREKANNGVGNGVDAQPPGNPPVNDGMGTGNRGNTKAKS